MENYLNVTIPFRFQRSSTAVTGANLTEAEQRMVRAMRENPRITIRELTDRTGYSDGYVRKLIAAMKAKFLIRREGSNKTGIWVILTGN